MFQNDDEERECVENLLQHCDEDFLVLWNIWGQKHGYKSIGQALGRASRIALAKSAGDDDKDSHTPAN